MSISNFLENKLLDHSLGGTAYTQPSTIYVALYTSDPTDADSGTEVTGGSYARQSVAFAAASGGSKASNATVTFPTATANWGTVTHIGLRDASTAGNLLWSGALSSSASVTTGTTFSIASGALTCTLD
jgi:hypothetical protein